MRQKRTSRIGGVSPKERDEKRLQREEAKAKQKAERPPGAKQAEGWWKERHQSYYPHITFIKWDNKNLKQANDLLTEFGATKMQKAFDYIFEKWNVYRSSKDHKWKATSLVPTWDFLYHYRRDIMAEVENVMKSGADKKSDSSGFFY